MATAGEDTSNRKVFAVVAVCVFAARSKARAEISYALPSSRPPDRLFAGGSWVFLVHTAPAAGFSHDASVAQLVPHAAPLQQSPATVRLIWTWLPDTPEAEAPGSLAAPVTVGKVLP